MDLTKFDLFGDMRIFSYWYNCLKDDKRMSKSLKEFNDNPPFCNIINWQNPNMSKEMVKPLASKIYWKANKIYNYNNLNTHLSELARGNEEILQNLLETYWENSFPIPVMIAPVQLSFQSAPNNTILCYPIIFPATIIKSIDNKYNIIPKTKEDEDLIFPWFQRDMLNPVSSYKSLPPIGDIQEWSQFCLENELVPEELDEYLMYIYRMIEQVTGNQIDDFQDFKYNQQLYSRNDGYTRIVLDTSADFSTQALEEIYDELLSNNNKLEHYPLLKTFSMSCSNTELINNKFEERNFIHKHYGHMSRDYSLFPTQRIAMQKITNIKDCEILAINGPPGTGKTTMIQNILAQNLVESVIDEIPRLMVCTSNNNQSLINIIERLNFLERQGQDVLDKRWLDVKGLSLYLAGSTGGYNAKPIGDNANVNNIDNIGGNKEFSISIRTPEFRENAKRSFIENFKKYFDTLSDENKTIDEMIKILRNKIVSTKEFIELISEHINDFKKMRDLYKSIREPNITTTSAGIDELIKEIEYLGNYGGFNIKLLKSLLTNGNNNFSDIQILLEKQYEINRSNLNDLIINVSNKISDNLGYILEDGLFNEKLLNSVYEENLTFITIEEFLDKTLRVDLFWLAIHYWEARWIKICQNTTNLEIKRTQESIEKLHKINAMLVPCALSTPYTLPIHYQYSVINNGVWNNQYLYNHIDLLIVDEAGQMMPEIIAPIFTLAKKAIILGDEKQIQPISQINKVVSYGNVQYNNIYNNIEDNQPIYNLKFKSHEGSVMKASQGVTGYQVEDYDTKGLLIAEHMRCYDEIISFCNNTFYNGMLIPKRGQKPEEENKFLPAMGYANIYASSDTNITGGSKGNTKEASIIVDWLLKNANDLSKKYKSEIIDIIGIITPFRKQSEYIRNIIRERTEQKDILRKLTIGTVHAFQGGEKKVIIFSSVYGHNDADSNYFFDVDNGSMINVAVSRAQDSFLFFGCIDTFNKRNINASSQLMRYLLNLSDNEICNIEPTPKYIDIQQNIQIERLDTLQSHIDAMSEAFANAEDLIVIESPFVTCNAIRNLDLINKINSAVKRNVKVKIYINSEHFNNKIYEDGYKLLCTTNAEIYTPNNFHNKTLYYDEEMLVEGSFNWLSASHDENTRNKEVSFKTSMETAKHFIEEIQLEQDNGLNL